MGSELYPTESGSRRSCGVDLGEMIGLEETERNLKTMSSWVHLSTAGTNRKWSTSVQNVSAGPCHAPRRVENLAKGIFMRLVRLRAPGGLENLKLVEEVIPNQGRMNCWSGSGPAHIRWAGTSPT